MTELARVLVAVVVGLPLLAAAVVAFARSARQADLIASVVALAIAAAALTLAVLGLSRGTQAPLRGQWFVVDGASGLFLAVTAVIGACSVLLSPSYLRSAGRSWLSSTASHSWYYVALFTFWSALLAVPVVGNLAVVWLIVEATTAASALLVSFSGGRDALEAGWKYLVLTTLGLSVALLGIVVVAIGQAKLHHHGLHALDWRALHAAASALDHRAAVTAFVLLLAGLATKVGWAPVHNWLPDAHSEAPAPISALLSAALLPTVLLVAWRVKASLEPAVGSGTAAAVFIGFGLASVIVAIPFLWQTLPWKRLLAYSSLEHMGIIALGVGFGSPLAIAGVIVHVAGHALAKALGFYAALPLLRIDRGYGKRAPSGVASESPRTAAAMGLSLAALAGLPPSPLFVSELLIVLGGVTAGYTVISAVAVVGLALGFLGLLHALLEGVVGEPHERRRSTRRRGERSIAWLTGAFGVASLALALAGAAALPGSTLVATLMRGTL
ncbi:MAG: proton-conducting transporter transmembrane domain-containing protein [Solirubrobacteraceae bacterium]